MHHADVLVIGGGIAGLAAAADLARHGKHTMLIEARDRLGGRICTHRSEGPRAWTAELGAEFVHGDDPEFSDLLVSAGLRTRTADVPMRWWQEGRWELVEDFWERVGALADRIPKSSRGWSFDEFLRRRAGGLERGDRERTRAYVQSFNAAPAARLSAWCLRENRAGADDDDRFVVNGYDRLVRLLERRCREAGVDIRLGVEVSRVAWSRGTVEASVRAGRRADPRRCHAWQGRAAIVTVPLGVLKRGDVCFQPALESKRPVIEAMGWGHVVRVVVRFHGGLGTQTWLPVALRRAGGRRLGFIHAPAPILVGWAGGPAGERIAGLPARRLCEVAVGSLVRLSGAERGVVRSAVAEVLTHDWSGDPFSRGAYSYVAAGAERAAAQLARPVERTLFFAGEATAEATGTVHGALHSGRRAAREVTHTLD